MVEAVSPEEAVDDLRSSLVDVLRSAPAGDARADLRWHSDFELTYVNDAGEQVQLAVEVKSIAATRLDRYRNALVDELDVVVAERLEHLDVAGREVELLGAPAELARRIIAQLPMTPSPLEELTGPFYDTPSLSKWLGVTRQALDSRVRNKALLGLPVADGPRIYPVWQFAEDKTTLRYLSDLLKILASGTPDPWTWALWLSAPDDDHDGLTAHEWLAQQRDPAPLLVEARADAARWAS